VLLEAKTALLLFLFLLPLSSFLIFSLYLPLSYSPHHCLCYEVIAIKQFLRRVVNFLIGSGILGIIETELGAFVHKK